MPSCLSVVCFAVGLVVLFGVFGVWLDWSGLPLGLVGVAWGWLWSQIAS